MGGLGLSVETQHLTLLFVSPSSFLLKDLSFLAKLLRDGFPVKFPLKGNDLLPLDLRAPN